MRTADCSIRGTQTDRRYQLVMVVGAGSILDTYRYLAIDTSRAGDFIPDCLWLGKTKEKKMSEEIIVNSKGGKQSKIFGRITEVPPIALRIVSGVMAEGRIKYPREEDGSPNWYKISCLSNLDHAGEHLENFLTLRNGGPRVDGNGNDDYPADELEKLDWMSEELSHFAARAMMALEQWEREGIGED